MNKVDNKQKYVIFAVLVLSYATSVFAATGPFSAFEASFFAQAKQYVLPVVLMVTIVAAGITYMKTKDWVVSLVVGGISAGIIGGAIQLASSFADFNLSTS